MNPSRTPRASRQIAPWLAFAAVAVACRSGADTSAPTGAQIFERGIVRQGTSACQSCHGAVGKPPINARTPRIAGLNADYLARQLDLFSKGLRQNLAMVDVARSLTPEQRETTASYVASLPSPPAWGADPIDRGEIALGRQLAQRGRWGVDVPPCASCHGVDGLGMGSVSPPLPGQSALYIEAQLADWSDGARKGDPLGLMTGIAKRLSAADRREVAAYYAYLPLRSPASSAPPGGAR